MAKYHAHHNFLQIQLMNVLTILVRTCGDVSQVTNDCSGGSTDITGRQPSAKDNRPARLTNRPLLQWDAKSFKRQPTKSTLTWKYDGGVGRRIRNNEQTQKVKTKYVKPETQSYKRRRSRRRLVFTPLGRSIQGLSAGRCDSIRRVVFRETFRYRLVTHQIIMVTTDWPLASAIAMNYEGMKRLPKATGKFLLQ